MADKTAKRIAELIKPLRVKPGAKVNLAKDFNPGCKAGFVKKDGGQLLRTGIALLADTSGGWPPGDLPGAGVPPGGGSRRRPPGTSRTALTD